MERGISYVEKLEKTYRNQIYEDFTMYQIPYERLLLQYDALPNETCYIIDCKKAEVEFLNPKKFTQITKIKPQENSLFVLYEQIAASHIPKLATFINSVLPFSFDPKFDFIPEKETIQSCYRSFDDRVFLKMNTPLFSNAGVMHYSLGKIIDVTGLIDGKNFSYRVDMSSKERSKRLISSVHGMLRIENYLSTRELEILILISKGMTSRQISLHLQISKNTVDNHRRNIIQKLEASSSVEAYRKAIDLGLITTIF